jgi:hypothetical protein
MIRTAPAPKTATISGLPPQGELDFGNHLPAGMETFSIPFLMRWFHTGPQHWINLIESGAIKATTLQHPKASKTMYRVPRAELIRFLNSRTQ